MHQLSTMPSFLTGTVCFQTISSSTATVHDHNKKYYTKNTAETPLCQTRISRSLLFLMATRASELSSWCLFPLKTPAVVNGTVYLLPFLMEITDCQKSTCKKKEQQSCLWSQHTGAARYAAIEPYCRKMLSLLLWHVVVPDQELSFLTAALFTQNLRCIYMSLMNQGSKLRSTIAEQRSNCIIELCHVAKGSCDDFKHASLVLLTKTLAQLDIEILVRLSDCKYVITNGSCTNYW